ncbi:MAG: AraC family transcriptional regulator [Geminicoccaceae bacterium]|nr:AraC family transcriptional regulator [Geminicoccaceae bacterium]
MSPHPARERPLPRVSTGGYVEHPPSAALRPFVECVWTREPGPRGAEERTPLAHRVLPDGSIDIVLEFGPGRGVPSSIQAVGTMTRALVVDAVSDDSFVGVRFRPARATAFLRLPANELTDLRVPLDDVWSDTTAVREAFERADGRDARVAALESVLVARLSHVARTEHPDVDEAVRRIIATGGSLGITRLAPALGVTRQHLARRFADLVGVSPKTFARVVRVRRVIAAARATPDRDRPNWSALALDAGYYDQAHLVDEFRELTGLAPTAWWRTQRPG